MIRRRSQAKEAHHEAIVSELRLLGLRIGLLINFHEEKLVDGAHRIVNEH